MSMYLPFFAGSSTSILGRSQDQNMSDIHIVLFTDCDWLLAVTNKTIAHNIHDYCDVIMEITSLVYCPEWLQCTGRTRWWWCLRTLPSQCVERSMERSFSVCGALPSHGMLSLSSFCRPLSNPFHMFIVFLSHTVFVPLPFSTSGWYTLSFFSWYPLNL